MWPFADAYPERRVADIDGQTFDYIIVGGKWNLLWQSLSSVDIH